MLPDFGLLTRCSKWASGGAVRLGKAYTANGSENFYPVAEKNKSD